MRGAILLLGLLSLGLGAGSAWAQPAKGKPPDARMADAKRFFDEGEASYLRGSYEEAIAAWEKSYEISKRPLIFWNIANAHERLGHSKQAREYLAKWREQAPEEEHELIDARLQKLDERIARDDAEARRREAEQRRRREEEEQGKRERKRVTAGPPERSPLLTAGVALGGAGVGAVAVGLTLGFVASSRRPEPSEVCALSGNRQVCRESSRDEIESSNTLAAVGDVMWIVGAVMVASGIALVVTHLPEEPATQATATKLGPLAGKEGGGLWLQRTF